MAYEYCGKNIYKQLEQVMTKLDESLSVNVLNQYNREYYLLNLDFLLSILLHQYIVFVFQLI